MSRVEGGRWRVRWRELVRQADGNLVSKQREKTVYTEAAAIELRAKVLRSLDIGEIPQVEAVRVEPPCCSLDAVIAGWMRAQKARGAAAGSLRAYGQRAARVLAAMRKRHGIPDDKGVSASLLTRSEVTEITLHLRDVDKLSASTLQGTIATLLRVWAWGCDDPDAYPGLPPAPRDTTILVPRGPVWRAPPAPTMAECDAVIRQLAGNYKAQRLALPVAVLGRFTGLRTSQILALRVGDVDVEHGRLVVSTGKSAREKAGRTAPIAPALAPFLRDLAGGRAADELLIRRRADTLANSRSGPTDTLRVAWEAATAAGEARREVWDPPNREIARPDHAFRAAFQAFLKSERVDKTVIDALVGHAEGLREQHYAGADTIWPQMVEAVALLPPIVWRLEEENEGGEVIPIRR